MVNISVMYTHFLVEKMLRIENKMRKNAQKLLIAVNFKSFLNYNLDICNLLTNLMSFRIFGLTCVVA